MAGLTGCGAGRKDSGVMGLARASLMTALGSVAGLAVLLSLAGLGRAAEPAGVTVLDTGSVWMIHDMLKPPEVDNGGKLEPFLMKVSWLDSATPAAPADWMESKFNDSSWLRTTARGGACAPYVARECLRGKFEVRGPAQVRGLRLSLDYHGGAIVYLNGKELLRRHLPAGPIGENTLAEAYPAEAFTGPAGRDRNLVDFPIPPAALRQGVNVLAIGLVRAPYGRKVLDETSSPSGRKFAANFDWYTCQLVNVRLAADRADGLVPNAARPDGLQFWNSDLLSSDSTLDYGDQCQPPQPIRLVGAVNGTFSGKIVVGSSKPLTGLKARAGSLQGSGGSIPATAVRIRYGCVWGREDGFTGGDQMIRSPYSGQFGFFGALADAPPEAAKMAESARKPAAPAATVVPIWVSVQVPGEAKPGIYNGEIVVEAAGEAAVKVPVRLEVSDFRLPDPQNYRTWVELIQSPDTLAIEYDEPLWSARHFEMIANSFRLVSDTGSRVVHLSAIAHTNLGNAESMIRWVKKGEKSYEWDFTLMDKYLDVAQKNLGTPKLVVLQVWEVYMSTKESIGKRFSGELEERHKVSGGRPLATILDRATGLAANAPLPDLTDPASKAIWQALIQQVRQHLAKRGLEKTLMLGMFTDALPSKEHIQFFHDIAPDLAWVQEGHGRWQSKIYGISEIGYQATVWGGFRFADGMKQTNQEKPPIVESLHGWKEPRLDVVFERNTGLDSYPCSRWLFYPETAITSELRGIGRTGADYWRAVKNKSGRRQGYAHERFVEGDWGGSGGSLNLNLCSSVLAPGPSAAIATTRLMALKEGIQEAEARITIERALTDPALKARLGDALAKRCQETLDRRLHTMWKTLSNFQMGKAFFFGAGSWRWAPGIPGHRWFLASGWQDQTKELYDLAGQVQRKVGS